MKKNLGTIKILYFLTGIVLLCVVCVLSKNNIISTETYIFNTVLVAVAIFLTIIAVIMYNKCVKQNYTKPSPLRLILSFISPFIMFGLYHLPFLGFVGLKGVNNSIIGIYVFSLYGLFVYDISYFIKAKYYAGTRLKSRNIVNFSHSYSRSHLGGVQNISKNNGTYYLHMILKYIAVFFILMSFFIAVFNIIFPKVDMSLFTEMNVFSKMMN